MRKFLFGLQILFLSCNSIEPGQKHTFSKDTFTEDKPTIINSTPTPKITSINSNNGIIGYWKSENKESITVQITEDSVYYIEHLERHSYQLKNDSIFIFYPDFIFNAKAYFNGDTLVFESENGKSQYTKLP